MSKKALVLAFILAAFLISGCKKTSAVQSKSECESVAASAEVIIVDNGFMPSALSVKKCTEVTFKNTSAKSAWVASDLHPTHGIYPEFDPLVAIKPAESWRFVFGKVGNWKYHDHLQPKTKGLISVSE